MTVESERGVGSSFIVYLHASAGRTSSKKQLKVRGIATKGRILVMDDEETVLDWTGIVSNYLGYNVENAGMGSDR